MKKNYNQNQISDYTIYFNVLLPYCMKNDFLFTYLTITSEFGLLALFPFVVIIIATDTCLSYNLRTSRGTSWSESGRSSLRWHNWNIHDRSSSCSWDVNHHVWYSRINHIDNGKFNCKKTYISTLGSMSSISLVIYWHLLLWGAE